MIHFNLDPYLPSPTTLFSIELINQNPASIERKRIEKDHERSCKGWGFEYNVSAGNGSFCIFGNETGVTVGHSLACIAESAFVFFSVSVLFRRRVSG